MEQKFLEVIKEALDIEGREIELSDNFRDYDEWDSLARLSLIAALDDNFGIQIEDDEFSDMNALSDIYAKIKDGE